jgi:hypothetical protein
MRMSKKTFRIPYRKVKELAVNTHLLKKKGKNKSMMMLAA